MITKKIKYIKLIVCFIVGIFYSFTSVFGQANLTIVNNSARTMTVKVMKGNSSYSSFYDKVYVSPWSSSVVNFYESGNYFTKSKATLSGKNPVYRKGKPFYVTNDESGYSVFTLTFSIRETNIPKASGGVSISQQEFDKN